MNDTKQLQPGEIASKWRLELDLAEKASKKWADRAKKIVKRYRDERDSLVSKSRRFNILWSNVRTLTAAVYAKRPQPDISRRYNDADPVARAASTIIERCLSFEIENYPDFDSAMRNAVTDRLLGGRGVAWVRYEPTIEAMGESGEAQLTDDAEAYEEVTHETSPVDYVYWEDFAHDPARTWEEVTWVARRVYLTKDQGLERFGDAFSAVPLTSGPESLDDDQKLTQEAEGKKKAEVWEIWSLNDKSVIWIAKGHAQALDVREDPLGLEGFFPCPKPLFATLTTDSLVPVPDYALYQDQAEELDEITERIALLVKAVKIVGVYDASQTGLRRMLSEGVDNTLIPVDTWAMFAERGGIKGSVDFMPLDGVLSAIHALYQAREQSKQIIYEVTGMADIIRGASLASETATAQQIKADFASLRLKELRQDVERFARDLVQLKAQIIATKYRPETIISISGIMSTADAVNAMPALDMMRNNPAREFQLDIQTDSMVDADEQQEKANRVEFLQAVSGFIEKAVQASQASPALAPLMGELLMFGVRGFKIGRTVESNIEQALQAMREQQAQAQSQPQPPKPDPAQIKAQVDMQIAQARAQADAQAQAARAQADIRIEQMRMQHEKALEAMRQGANDARELQIAQIEAAAKIEVARIGSQPYIDERTADAVNAEMQNMADPVA